MVSVPLCRRRPRRRPSSTGVLLLLSSAALPLGCQSTPVAADTQPVNEIRLENAQTRPPRVIGFLSPAHPKAKPGLVPAGFKVASVEEIAEVMAGLEEAGFANQSHAVIDLEPVETTGLLRRLVVITDSETRTLVVPRKPSQELADRFTEMARLISTKFNQITFMRYDPRLTDPELFKKEQKLLEQRNRRRTSGNQP